MAKRAKEIEAKEAVRLLSPGMTAFFPGGFGEPRALAKALAEEPGALRGVRLLETRLPGFRQETYAGFEDCRIEVTFLTSELADAHDRGIVHFVPMHYRDTWDWLARTHFDIAFLEVATPDETGRVSLGLCADFAPAVLQNSTILVAEVNSGLPSPPGSPRFELERFDFLVSSEHDPKVLPTTELPITKRGDSVAEEIANHAANLIDDGACLQTGIGSIPDAVLSALRHHKDLGCHSGMIGDGMMQLVSAGALTGRRKPIDAGRLVTGFVYGSKELYRWAGQESSLDLRSVDYTHDPRVLACFDSFVAVNSAVEIDLLGQVNAETVRGRQISGTGGSVDFARGASRAPNGRSIHALPSTAASGKVSRIVPRLAPGTPVTTLRTDVDAVVTEYGVAELRGLDLEARAAALIKIAHPAWHSTLESAKSGPLS